MSTQLTVCEVSSELKGVLDEFRFRKAKGIHALIMKVEKTSKEIVLEEQLEDTTIEELTEHLPSHQPRFVLLTYELKNEKKGITTNSLCFIFISPRDVNPELMMMYAGSKLTLQTYTSCNGKVFEVRELEEFTEEWLQDRLLST